MLLRGLVVARRSWSFAVFGFFVPDILIYNEGLKREQEMTKKLPDALDLLNLCVESGLSFQAALTQVANEPDRARSPRSSPSRCRRCSWDGRAARPSRRWPAAPGRRTCSASCGR